MSWFADKIPQYIPSYVTELEEIRLQGGVLEEFELEGDIMEVPLKDLKLKNVHLFEASGEVDGSPSTT